MDKTVVFAYGRFNPPTYGHQRIFERAAELPFYHKIVVSHTHNKKNPIPPDIKLQILKNWFPENNFELATKELPTWMHHIKKLSDEGFNDLQFIAGDDRLEEYRKIIDKYNGKEFHFDNVNMISSGRRKGSISATMMREYAKLNKFDLFFSGLPNLINKKDARKIFEIVKEHQ